MNKVHKDGRPLLTLSGKVERARAKELAAGKIPDSRPAPPHGIQRQDTDYDVKPEIPTPRSSNAKQDDRRKPERRSHQYHAAMPDSGMANHATQMGESENEHNHDAASAQARMLRSICG